MSSTYVSEDDLSVTMVSQELDQLKQMAVYFPVLFLGAASAFMLTATLISMRSLFDIFIFDELEKNQRQDISVSFSEYVEEKGALAVLQDPQVERLEGGKV